MIRFSKEKVLLLHELIAKETGGDAGFRALIFCVYKMVKAYKPFVERQQAIGTLWRLYKENLCLN